MPSIDQFEVLDVARQLAAHFASAASNRGWSEQQRRDLEQASAALWRARAVLLEDADLPGRRERRKRTLPPAQGMTAAQAAQAAGLSERVFYKWAARLDVGQKCDGRWRFGPEDVAAINRARSGEAPAT